MLSYLNCINEITEQTIRSPQSSTAAAGVLLFFFFKKEQILGEDTEDNNKISK